MSTNRAVCWQEFRLVHERVADSSRGFRVARNRPENASNPHTQRARSAALELANQLRGDANVHAGLVDVPRHHRLAADDRPSRNLEPGAQRHIRTDETVRSDVGSADLVSVVIDVVRHDLGTHVGVVPYFAAASDNAVVAQRHPVSDFVQPARLHATVDIAILADHRGLAQLDVALDFGAVADDAVFTHDANVAHSHAVSENGVRLDSAHVPEHDIVTDANIFTDYAVMTRFEILTHCRRRGNLCC